MNCRFCGRVCNRPCGLAIHERTCKQNPDRKPLENHVCNFPKNCKLPTEESGWKCFGCGINLKSRKELYEHRRVCIKYPLVKGKQNHMKKNYKCGFCGKEWFTTNTGFACHVMYCNCNPNKKTLKIIHHSELTRKIISECRKRTILEHGCEQNLKRRSYIYKGEIFSSSYEVKYALYCEEHNIEYILHPAPIKYRFKNEEHLYFPDFYIPSEDKYVDPKNSYLINKPQKHLGISDTEKIELVSEQNGIKIEIIDGKDIVCNSSKLKEIIKQKN